MANLYKANIEDEIVVFNKSEDESTEVPFIHIEKSTFKNKPTDAVANTNSYIKLNHQLNIPAGVNSKQYNLDNSDSINSLDIELSEQDKNDITGDLTTILSKLKRDIRLEESTRTSNDTTLQNNINSEASTRLEKDTELLNKIEALDCPLTGSDGNYIKTVQQDDGLISVTTQIFDKIINSSSTDNNVPTSKAVYDHVNTEKSARTSAITSLNTKVDTEITNRSTADTNLNTLITNETTRATNSENEISALLKGLRLSTGTDSIESDKIYYSFGGLSIYCKVEVGWHAMNSSDGVSCTKDETVDIPEKKYFKFKIITNAVNNGVCRGEIYYTYENTLNELNNVSINDYSDGCIETYQNTHTSGVPLGSANANIKVSNKLYSKIN